MQFFYKARAKSGEIITGTMEASDQFALARELRSHGNIPISVSGGKGNNLNMDALFQQFFGRVGIQEQITFTKNLSGMLKAGLALSRALSVLKKQTKNVKFFNILTGLDTEIDAGGTLSSGLSKYPNTFSRLFISMIRAGEESGNLAGALSEIGSNLEKSHNITKKVRGALIYPGVILTAMVLIGILMFAFVVPTLAKTFENTGATLPASTRFIIFLGDFLSKHLILALLSLVVFVLGLIWVFRAKFLAKYIDFIVLRLPVIKNMSKELNTARTARTISSLLTSGVPITRSIEITQDVVQNTYYKKVLAQAIVEIEKGAPFSEVFVENSDLYPVMMSEMVQVGEETGKLSEMLLQIAVFYEESVEAKTKNLSTIIEPVLMMIIGIVVGFFAVSMLSPMYKAMENVK